MRNDRHISSTSSGRGVSLACAWLTALYLLGGLAGGLAVALPISVLPVPGEPHLVRNVLSGAFLFVVLVVASVGWGRSIASRTGCPDNRRMGWVAAMSFAPTLVLVGTVLGVMEPLFIRLGAAEGLPIHVIFTLLFVPSAFFVAAVTAFAMGWSLNGAPLALKLAWQTGLAAAVAFFAADVLMDSIGWRVGAPGAAQRATMLTVTLVGTLAAALAGGAALGFTVHQTTPSRETSDR